jgi:signal transduction histidine kinase
VQQQWRRVRDEWLRVNASEPEQKQRGQLLSILLTGLVILVVTLLALDLIGLIVTHSPQNVLYMVSDVCGELVLVGLWYWNRRGHTQSASYAALVFFILSCSVFFSMSDLNRSLVLYVIPIMAASFLIRPGSSFVAAALSALAYSLTWLASGSVLTYNYTSVLSLFIIALLVWLIAARLEADRIERRRAEESLRESEKLLREIAANYPNSYLSIIEPDLTIGFTSGQEFKKRGLNPDNFVGLTLERVFGEHAPFVLENYVKAFDGIGTEFELFFDGQYQFYRVIPLADDNGQVKKILAVVENITERKRAAEKIESLAKFPHENPNPILRVGRDGVLLYASPSSQPLLDCWSIQAGQSLPQAWHKLVLESLASGQNQEVEVECGDITYSLVLAPIAEEGYVNLYGRDITKRKRAEEALRASERRERERADELQTIMDAVPTLVWVAHDPSCSMVTGNRACYKFLHVPSGENLSKVSPDGGLLLHYEYYRDGARLPLHELPLQMAARGDFVRDYEYDVVFEDGTTHHLVGNASPLREAQSRLRGAVAAFIDITERKRAENKLECALAELERSNADLQQFAYAASHDLQEPLRMITSYLQLIAQRYRSRLDADADEFITFAVDGAARMQRLIRDLLAYSRVGTRGQPFTPTDCEAVLEQALANLQIAIEESSATVTHDPLPAVLADEGQLVQVFQNLIGNAVKFHGVEPPCVHISVHAHPLPPVGEGRGEGWEFSVRDNGIGIEPKQFERIFTVFQRLHTQTEYPGSGIGLAICKKIVERHGGRIWVESQPGQGSTFYFTLPAAG